VPSESPDFWVKKKNRNIIGIELTRLNPANAEAPNSEKLSEILFRKELIEHTKAIFERTSEKVLFVKFLFSERMEITKERVMSVSVRMAGLIRNKVVNWNRTAFFTESISQKELPNGFMNIINYIC